MTQEQAEMTEQYLYAKSMRGYRDWLYKHFPIGNGDMLVELEENTLIQLDYLRDMGLPEDTELSDD